MATIKVFSTPTCPWCTKLKNYLREHKVNFQDIDVSKDPYAAMGMFQRSGQQGVPQMWIDNNVIVGFDKEKIDRLLNL